MDAQALCVRGLLVGHEGELGRRLRSSWLSEAARSEIDDEDDGGGNMFGWCGSASSVLK